MTEPDGKTVLLLRNLKDAGCDTAMAEQFLAYEREKKNQAQRRLLLRQRDSLLRAVHENQIGVAFMMYSTDYNHYLPLGYAGYSASCTGDPKERSWIHKLSPYLGDGTFPNEQYPSCGNSPESTSPFVMRKSFYWCKSPVTPTSFRKNSFPYGGNSQDRYRYAMNAALNETSFGVIASAGTSCGYKTMKLVKVPASTLLVGECYGEYPIYSWWSFFEQYGNIPHKRKSNMLYCDGHVDTIAEGEVPRNNTALFWRGF